MKTMRVIVGMLYFLTMGNCTFAHEGETHDGGSESVMNEPAGEAVGNTICPVSGDKIGGKMGKPYEYAYEGKVYNLCCKMCVKDFKKDPAKYSKIAEENAQNSLIKGAM